MEDAVCNLKRPCLCSGTAAYVHPSCALTWIREAGIGSCEVCLAPVELEFERQSIWHRDVLRLWWRSYKWLFGCFIVSLIWLFLVLPVGLICVRRGVYLASAWDHTVTARGVCFTAYFFLFMTASCLLAFIILTVRTLTNYRNTFWGRPYPVGVRNRRYRGVAETTV